jgi:hypothetical protein
MPLMLKTPLPNAICSTNKDQINSDLPAAVIKT